MEGLESKCDLNKSSDKEPMSILTQNLEVIFEFLCYDKQYQSIVTPVFKLIDHVKIENARIGVYDDVKANSNDLIEALNRAREEYSSDIEVSKTRKEIKDAKRSINNSTKELKEVTKEAKNLQAQVVSVLGIFSAIIIAFFGGFNFISSALAGLNSNFFLATIFVCTICGFILLNAIFMLMYFIGKILDKNIYARCETENCSCSKKCWAFNRVRKRLPYVFWLNIFMLIILGIDGIVLIGM